MMLVTTSFKQSSKSSARAAAIPLSRANSRNQSESGRSAASSFGKERLACGRPPGEDLKCAIIGGRFAAAPAGAGGPYGAPRFLEIVDDRKDPVHLRRLEDLRDMRLRRKKDHLSLARHL